jgi:hypothetical protein|tara:strand:- start:1081 stop:1596 length:516 start_codon:yes stop_codon:yes gene_type:complete
MELDTALYAALEALSEQADSADNGTLDEVGARYQAALHLSLVAKQIRDVCEESLNERMESDAVTIPNVGRFVRSRSLASATFRDKSDGPRFREDLAHAVATKVAIDIGTGEINQERRNIAKETIRVLSMYVPSISGTKGNAKSELNLNIDDYKSRQWRNTVKLEEGVQDHE